MQRMGEKTIGNNPKEMEFASTSRQGNKTNSTMKLYRGGSTHNNIEQHRQVQSETLATPRMKKEIEFRRWSPWDTNWEIPNIKKEKEDIRLEQIQRKLTEVNKMVEEFIGQSQQKQPIDEYQRGPRAVNMYPLYMDAHTHADRIIKKTKWEGTFNELMFDMIKKGKGSKYYQAAITNFCDPENFHMAGKIMREKNVFSTYGLHPKKANMMDLRLKNEIIERFEHDHKAHAIGEIGLDYSGNKPDKIRQERAFRDLLEYGARRNIPIVIHSRYALKETFKILKEVLQRNHHVHFHCTADKSMIVNEITQHFREAKFGFTNLVEGEGMISRNSRRILQNLPLNKVLIESDGPYFPNKGSKIGHPADLEPLIETIAKLHKTSKREVMETTARNCRRLYNISDTEIYKSI